VVFRRHLRRRMQFAKLQFSRSADTESHLLHVLRRVKADRTVAEIFLLLSCARMRHAISSSVAMGSAPSAVFRLDGVGFMVAAIHIPRVVATVS